MRLIILFLISLLLSCEKGATSKIDSFDTEEAWDYLCSAGGCLVGQQDSVGRLGEGTCLAEPEWQCFLNNLTHSRIKFLCGKLSLVEKTSIHTCPFQATTEGELSLYTLQHLTKKPWKSYDGSNTRLKEFIDTWEIPEGMAGSMGEQDMIWEMLKDSDFVSALTIFYEKS